jgi:hypothetical protein
MDHEEFRKRGYAAVDAIIDYYQTVEKYPG